MKYVFSILITLITLFFFNCKSDYPKVQFTAEMGSFVVEIYLDKAPITANNFLRYVRENRYKDAVIYRTVTPENQPQSTVKIEVIQGGLWAEDHPDRLTAIAHESTQQTGILHRNGVISMARSGPGSASDAFFICIGDQPELDFNGRRNPDGQGFAAFGKVISGMEIVKKIQLQNAAGQYLEPHIALQIHELK